MIDQRLTCRRCRARPAGPGAVALSGLCRTCWVASELEIDFYRTEYPGAVVARLPDGSVHCVGAQTFLDALEVETHA